MVDTTTRGGGGGAVADDDMGGEGMQCNYHPYRNSSPGGICAFCLQDKLGKLVSSSSFVGTSFRSDSEAASLPSFSLTLRPVASASASSGGDDVGNGRYQHHQCGYYARRARLPFLLAQKKKKKSLVASSASSDVVLKRSNSTVTPRSGRYIPSCNEDFMPRRRGFWSFLHLSAHKKSDRLKVGPGPGPAEPSVTAAKRVEYLVVDEADSSPNSSGGGSNTASFGRKVSRSRSVGCGSRSFSGDFFERMSTGFGDCTLRRVESHREGRRSISAARASTGDTMKDRISCGGLFGGFMITSSSSSSSSSSYWASMAEDQHINGRPNGPPATPGAGSLVYGRSRSRSRSWGWAFASPIRAFSKPASSTTTTKDGNRGLSSSGGGGASTNSNGATTTPNLAAVPSLLAVRG